MNPMALMKIKSMTDKFKKNHPKIFPFFTAVSKEIGVDSILEIKLTTAEGKSIVGNIKVSQEDIDLVKEIASMAQN